MPFLPLIQSREPRIRAQHCASLGSLWRLIVCCSLVATASGCRSTTEADAVLKRYPPGATPVETYDSLHQAFLAGEYVALFDLATTESQQQFEALLQDQFRRTFPYLELGLDPEELRKLPSREAFDQLFRAMAARDPGSAKRIEQAQLQGEPVFVEPSVCILTRRFPDGTSDQIQLVQQGEAWKLRLELK